MIRRKLTRIEVTLEDTKDVDDLFSKSTSAIILQAITNNDKTATSKKFCINTGNSSSIINDNKSLSIGRQHARIRTLNSSSSVTNKPTTPITSINIVDQHQIHGFSSQTPQTTSTTNNDEMITPIETKYNPQPYNSSSRFK
jgi:hypothetical protein